MENPATTTGKPELSAEELNRRSVAKRESVEKDLATLEKSIATLREFVVKWADILAPFNYSASAYSYPTIAFYSYGEENKDPKKIARAIGNDGWKRIKDPHTCGAINWQKDVDGVKITIHAAEKVDMKLIEEVKL